MANVSNITFQGAELSMIPASKGNCHGDSTLCPCGIVLDKSRIVMQKLFGFVAKRKQACWGGKTACNGHPTFYFGIGGFVMNRGRDDIQYARFLASSRWCKFKSSLIQTLILTFAAVYTACGAIMRKVESMSPYGQGQKSRQSNTGHYRSRCITDVLHFFFFSASEVSKVAPKNGKWQRLL